MKKSRNDAVQTVEVAVVVKSTGVFAAEAWVNKWLTIR
jgi:hypothetical protein